MASAVTNDAAFGATDTVPRRWSPWAASLASVWSLAYGMLGLYWSFGGAGFPYAETVTESWMSPITGIPSEVGGPVIALLGLLSAIVALAMSRAWGAGPVRSVMMGFGWTIALTLLLVIPDGRFLALVGYLPALIFGLGFDAVDWPMLNQGVCLAGGFAWAAATLVYQRRTAVPRHNRTVTARHVTARAPRWGGWATIAAALLPLPYAATRLAWALGYPLGIADPDEAAWATDPAIRLSELSLGGMALGGALLTLGLIQRWGEVFPSWIPVLGSRRVPPALAVIPAAIASAVLITGGWGLWRMVVSDGLAGPAAIPTLVPGLAFLPWGIALGLATLAYHERRRIQDAAQGQSRPSFTAAVSASRPRSAGG